MTFFVGMTSCWKWNRSSGIDAFAGSPPVPAKKGEPRGARLSVGTSGPAGSTVLIVSGGISCGITNRPASLLLQLPPTDFARVIGRTTRTGRGRNRPLAISTAPVAVKAMYAPGSSNTKTRYDTASAAAHWTTKGESGRNLSAMSTAKTVPNRSAARRLLWLMRNTSITGSPARSSALRITILRTMGSRLQPINGRGVPWGRRRHRGAWLPCRPGTR